MECGIWKIGLWLVTKLGVLIVKGQFYRCCTVEMKLYQSWKLGSYKFGILTLLEILGFAIVACNCKFVQLPKTSCTWHAVACDSTYATCIYGVSIHVHTYIPI
jgi:hypothetical protein